MLNYKETERERERGGGEIFIFFSSFVLGGFEVERFKLVVGIRGSVFRD